MAHEVEAAAADGLGGFFSRRRAHSAPPGTPCANCATPLLGPWCHACGQLGEDFHRSLVRLMLEAVEGVLHLDGRLWRTLPDLFLRPAKLTRAYLDGHRAPQIPPLRLFLVVLLLVFFVGTLGPHKTKFVNLKATPGATAQVIKAPVVVQTDSGGAKADGEVKIDGRSVTTFGGVVMVDSADGSPAKKLADYEAKLAGKTHLTAGEWLKLHALRALADPERFNLILQEWGERFAFLTLPMATILLSLIFVFNRRFYVFDHAIFSLHSLSAVGLMAAVSTGLQGLTFGVSELLLLAAPLHLYKHMRGVYGTSRLGTLLRMAILGALSLIGVAFIYVGLVAVGLNGMS
ncbi:MAG: DUF3667 domain-containing protein [Alphaproteobacteria bacterium]|nr:DUF3667 domain-containing protein [Alphaproteobacteria bacterium]